ncbi:MAG TPA: VanW family protein [Chloroflexota bacterium]|nr:VanW family protein [Chloroflexota bacterium]
MPKKAPSHRPYRIFGLAVIVSMVAVVALCRATIGVAFADRIYPGVQVDGIDVGGRTAADAGDLLAPQLADYASQTLLIRAGQQQFKLTPVQLGFSAQPDEVARAAFAVGREGGLPAQAFGPILAAQWTTNVPASALVDDTALSTAIDRLAEQIDQPGHPARLAIGNEVTLVPETPGRALAKDRAAAIIRQSLLRFDTKPIDLPVVADNPTLTATQLAPLQAQAEQILGETLVLTANGQTWPVPGSQLRADLEIQQNPTRLDYPPRSLERLVASAAGQINRPARDARILVVNGKVVIDDAQVGYQVDQSATLGALHARFLATGQAASLDVPMVVKTTEPGIPTTALEPVGQQAQALIDHGLSFAADDARYPLTPDQFGALLAFSRAANGQWTVSLDAQKVTVLIGEINAGFQRPEPNARFQIDGNSKVTLLRPVVSGRVIDQKAAVDAVLKDWRSGQVTLPVNHPGQDTSPAFLARVSADMHGIITDNTSSYAGSIPARAHNIELAVHNLNGTLVAPGETFSFNNAVGPTTLAAGFQWGFGIQGGDKSVETVPSVGGGICQVATSIFQPVYWAGYPIEERHWHDYWIEHYTSHGDVGLDATVDESAGLDFKFKNTTGHYILIDAWTAGETIHVELIGTRPDWTVRVTPPVVTNVIKAPTTIARTTSPLWPRGTTIITEAAADGFTAAIDRHVISPNGSDRVYPIRETYAPAQTTVLTGAG